MQGYVAGFITLSPTIKVVFPSISIELVADVSEADILKTTHIKVVSTVGSPEIKETCEVDET